MSKIKKVLAMLLTLALVLGMGITTFAAPGDANSKVTVKNADKATLTIAQVIDRQYSGNRMEIYRWRSSVIQNRIWRRGKWGR